MSIATDMLQRYIDAEVAVLGGLSVRWHDGRMLTRANLPEVQAGRREWQRIVDAERRIAAGGSAIRYQVADFS